MESGSLFAESEAEFEAGYVIGGVESEAECEVVFYFLTVCQLRI